MFLVVAMRCLIVYFKYNLRGVKMSSLLRSMLLVSFAGMLLVGCGAADKAADAAGEAKDAVVESAESVKDTATDAAAAVTEAASSEPGGYVPTEEERVPGITE